MQVSWRSEQTRSTSYLARLPVLTTHTVLPKLDRSFMVSFSPERISFYLITGHFFRKTFSDRKQGAPLMAAAMSHRFGMQNSNRRNYLSDYLSRRTTAKLDHRRIGLFICKEIAISAKEPSWPFFLARIGWKCWKSWINSRATKIVAREFIQLR